MNLAPVEFIALKDWHEARVKAEIYNADYRAALICWALWEPKRDSKVRKEPFTVDDFMPKRGKRVEENKPKQSIEEQQAIFMTLAGVNK